MNIFTLLVYTSSQHSHRYFWDHWKLLSQNLKLNCVGFDYVWLHNMSLGPLDMRKHITAFVL